MTRGELPAGVIDLGGNCPGGELSRGELVGGNCPGGIVRGGTDLDPGNREGELGRGAMGREGKEGGNIIPSRHSMYLPPSFPSTKKQYLHLNQDMLQLLLSFCSFTHLR